MNTTPRPIPSNPEAGSRRRELVILSVKATVSLAIVWFLATKVDFETLASRLSAEALVPLTIGIIAGILMMVLTAVRWWGIHYRIRAPIGFPFSIPATMECYALNLALPGSVGGDIVRAARAARVCGRMREAIMAVLLDRGGNLSAQMVMCVAVLPFLHISTASRDLQIAVILVTAVALVGVAVVYLSPALLGRSPLKRLRPVRELVRVGFILHRILNFPRAVFEIAFMSFVIQAGNVIMLWMAILAIGHGSVLLFTLIVAASFGMLGSALPVSFGGLGVREGAVVWVLLETGMAEAEAFMIAIVFGGLVISQAVPGLFIWAFGRLPPVIDLQKS